MNNEYIKTFDEVLAENIEHFKIKCPVEFLDKEKIVESDNDYIKMNDNEYINIKMIQDDIKYNCNDIIIHDKNIDIIAFDFDIEYITNQLIDLAIQNKWIDIDREDIVWFLTETFENIITTIENRIDRESEHDENGYIRRR